MCFTTRNPEIFASCEIKMHYRINNLTNTCNIFLNICYKSMKVKSCKHSMLNE